MDHSGKDLSPTIDYDRKDLKPTMDDARKDLRPAMDYARKDLWLKEREAADLAAPSCFVISSTLHVLQCSIATTATQPAMWPKIKIF